LAMMITMTEPSNSINISAPGKIILFGEHAVIYGRTAVAGCIDLRTYVNLFTSADGRIYLSLPDLGVERTWLMKDVRKAVDKLYEGKSDDNAPPCLELVVPIARQICGTSEDQCGVQQLASLAFLYLLIGVARKRKDLLAVKVTVRFNLPSCVGLGSSGAYCVCIAAALLQVAEIIPSPTVTAANNASTWSPQHLETIRLWASAAESLIHGRASGLDATICTYGGVASYRHGCKIEQLENLPDLKVLLVNSKVERNTSRMVTLFPEVIDGIFNAIDAISRDAIKILGQPQHSKNRKTCSEDEHYSLQEWSMELYSDVNELCRINNQLLIALGVGHPKIDQICTTLARYGIHPKMTGAGGGGSLFAFLKPNTSQTVIDMITSEVHKLGYDLWQPKLGGSGVVLHSSIPEEFRLTNDAPHSPDKKTPSVAPSPKLSPRLKFYYYTMSCAKVTQPVCLVVIDGWGMCSSANGNAICNAKTPVMTRLFGENSTQLEAHGLHVGLPEGLMGNSEVGHLNIGAGRVVYQDIVRINMAVTSGKIKENAKLVNACKNASNKNGRLHLLGLVSDGGVHSHIKHMFGLLEAAKYHKVPKCFIQFFSDGRDTSPTSGVRFVEEVFNFTKSIQYGQLATVVGRYYAMDRDKRWERNQIAYEGLVAGRGEKATEDTLIEVIKKSYDNNVTDEFLKPIIVNDEGRIKDDDTLIFFDYRADRMRQIVEAFGIKRNFETDVAHPKNLHISCMTQYNKDFTFPLLFPPESHKNVLAEWLAANSIPQFHCAETEKYAHVTFFFNGGREAPFDHEDRLMIPSPKVATYDLKPEMSCMEVGSKMAEIIRTKNYPFVMCNFAPPDMVGHTGIYEAAVKACEATDCAIGLVEKACQEAGYVLMITADHGNAEQMFDPKGGKHTAHTCNRVPFISTGKRRLMAKLPDREPALCDVAPTVLDQMGLAIPSEMGGKSLLQN
ncbi:2,3-bisphosphoglycerate-independent phosphoglycerate mutase, partial [Trichinella britovi]